MAGGVSPADQSKAALNLIDELKKARQVLTEGHNRKTLTVCNGRLGYVDPDDAARFLSGEIPRLTVYRTKKDARDRKSTRLNSSHVVESRMPSSA